MKKGALSHLSPSQKIMALLGISLITMIASMAIGMGLAMLIFQIPIDQANTITQMTSPQAINALKIVQLSYGLIGFGGGAVIAQFLFSKSPFRVLGLTIAPEKNNVMLTIGFMLIALPFVTWLGYINSFLDFPEALQWLEDWMQSTEETNQRTVKKFLQMDSFGDLALNLAVIAFVTAIGEELVFRGVLQQLIIPLFKNYHIGIWVSAAIFSAFHMQFYGFLPRMFLGMLFGYTFYWTKNLYLPILAHFINNGFAVVATYIYGFDTLDSEIESAAEGDEFSWVVAIMSLVITVGIAVLIQKTNAHKKALQNL